MKVIFLDIDGVLNSVRYDCRRTLDQGNIDETRMPLLRTLVDATQAHIVLSSSWRKHWEQDAAKCDGIGREINDTFAKYQLSVYDKTGCRSDNDRAEEIRTWLRGREDIEAYVILDDIAFGWGRDLADYVVRTDPRIGRGLEDVHVQRAIDLLNS